MLWMVMLVLFLAGCGASHPSDTAAGQELAEDSTVQKRSYTYRTEEIWCDNNGNRIYGIAYIPDTQEEKKPLVIFAHELGNTHAAGIPYAERLAEAGCGAYVFDFCGGTVGGGNRSSGSNVGMSVLTEVTDLEAVLETAATWDFVDPRRIVLLGGSQGGAVTALTGCRHPDRIAGMILMYPALNIAEDVHREFASLDSIPAEYDMFGGWIRVGRNYAADVWDVDFYGELSQYQGQVLLLHGDRDTTVDRSYSERAAEALPNGEYHVISGGGHEFYGAPFEEAVTLILAYMDRISAASHSPADGAQAPDPGTLSLLLGDTPVNVAWEENESVQALRELCARRPLVIEMSMYGGFEQVGSIGEDLPRDDQQTTTASGDIVLYSGSQIVVFYGSNSWAYTRLGHITDQDAAGMEALLGRGDIRITLRMEGNNE